MKILLLFLLLLSSSSSSFFFFFLLLLSSSSFFFLLSSVRLLWFPGAYGSWYYHPIDVLWIFGCCLYLSQILFVGTPPILLILYFSTAAVCASSFCFLFFVGCCFLWIIVRRLWWWCDGWGLPECDDGSMQSSNFLPKGCWLNCTIPKNTWSVDHINKVFPGKTRNKWSL